MLMCKDGHDWFAGTRTLPVTNKETYRYSSPHTFGLMRPAVVGWWGTGVCTLPRTAASFSFGTFWCPSPLLVCARAWHDWCR
jgi:hypothetical protein